METRGFLMAVPTSAEPPETAAATRPAARPCSKCGAEPRDPGQRWGKRCRTAHKQEARRLARMRRLTDSTQRHSTASDLSYGSRRGARVRLPALEAAASTLLGALDPTSRELIVQFATEGDGVDCWPVVVGALEHVARLLAPAPRST